MYFSPKTVVAVALVGQAAAMTPAQPPSAVLAVRGAVGQPSNLESTPAMFRRRTVEARDPRRGVHHQAYVRLPKQNIDRRDVNEEEADEAAYLEARDPRNFGAGFKTGLKIWDALRGGNNKRDVDEEADESAAFDEEADEEADESAHLEARDPRNFGAGFKTGLKIWDALRGGNNKRDVDEEAEESAVFDEEADEEADESAHLEARDPRNFGAGFKTGLKIWDALRGGNNKRDVDEEADESAAFDEEADESAHLEARDPRNFGAGFKTGLRIWDTLRGNNKRDIDEEADESAAFDEEAEESAALDEEADEEAEESAHLEARDPRNFGAGFKTGLKIWDALRGGNNKRDVDEEADESAAFDEEADEEAHLEARDPRRRRGPKPVYTIDVKRDVVDEAPAFDEEAHLEARDPRNFGAGFKTGLKIWDALRGNNNKRDIDEEAEQ